MTTVTTGIEWTDRTWNPVRGCSCVSEECRHCSAEREVALVESELLAPLRWRRPSRVFVNSMSDLFHESLPDDAIDRVFGVMAAAHVRGLGHTFQILTKRAARMRSYFAGADLRRRIACAGDVSPLGAWWPLPNVWLGVSVENQSTANERIPRLLQTPAAVRFVSAEPLLGPVDLSRWLSETRYVEHAAGCHPEGPCCGGVETCDPAINWVIVGGESGPEARPCDVEWIRSIVRQCKEAAVPVRVLLHERAAVGPVPVVAP